MDITKEMMLTAKTYMPIADKIALSTLIAENSVRPAQTEEQNKAANEVVALPMLYEEDVVVKICTLQSTLLSYYFNIEPSDGETMFEYYDEFAHLMNQLERFKSDKDIAFDLLDDWREFRKMVDTLIYNKRANLNDPLGRLGAAIALLSTPENVQKMSEELARATDDLQVKMDELKAEENDG